MLFFYLHFRVKPTFSTQQFAEFIALFTRISDNKRRFNWLMMENLSTNAAYGITYARHYLLIELYGLYINGRQATCKGRRRHQKMLEKTMISLLAKFFSFIIKNHKISLQFFHLSFTSLVYLQNITASSVSLSRPIKLSISTQKKQWIVLQSKKYLCLNLSI